MARPPTPFAEPVYVTRPMLPPLDEYAAELKYVWESAWLTNAGQRHALLEQRIGEYLRTPYVSLFNNGTTALLVACRALHLRGEVITTPFTFPATPHALTWTNSTPVFCDVDPTTLTLDPAAIEAAITPRTSGILGVHVFGAPCDVRAIQRIAERRDLKVIYDAAHAFGTELDGQPIARFGDATMFSFHATKLFHTAEGGALAIRDETLKREIDLLKNFGIKNEVEVVMPGINGKMNELQAALGLVTLRHIDRERRARGEIAAVYRARLASLPGVSCFAAPDHVRPSLQYFIARVNAAGAGISRDALWARLRAFNVFARRYFYPLCSEHDCYRSLPSASAAHLPVAYAASREVLALPFFGTLGQDGAHRVCDIIEHICLEERARASAPQVL